MYFAVIGVIGANTADLWWMIIEIGTDISNHPNEEGAHLISESLFVFMWWQNGSTCNVQEILAYFEEMVEIITIIGNEFTILVLPSLVH